VKKIIREKKMPLNFINFVPICICYDFAPSNSGGKARARRLKYKEITTIQQFEITVFL
jgi:hypothetical protein